MVGLSRHAVGDTEGAQAALESAVREAPDGAAEGCPQRIALLAAPAARRLLAASESMDPAAVERLAVLRVAVLGGGCSGLQYKMDLQDGPANRDILVETAGVKVVVDPKSALYVTGSELDYLDALEGGFKVKNPNAATSCSCGESFSA